MATSVPGAPARGGAAEAPGDGLCASDVSPRQERVLAEISHELGNYFHKLYYWAEILREQRSTAADAEPAALLEQTVRDLEAFLKTALEFFRPLSVLPTAMSVEELTGSIHALVARHRDPLPVRWHADVPHGAGSVSIDLGRFSFLLEGLMRRLDTAGQAAVSATVRTEGRAGDGAYVLELAVQGSEQGPGVSAAALIEWAIIERIVDLHGGSVDSSAAGGRRTVRLQLPMRS